MTDNNDNSEFESYLKGDDELSRTYRELEQESSPADLDALILKAAQESVKQKNQTNEGYFSTKYSIAASLCACVLITSLYLSDQRPTQETAQIIAFDSITLESSIQEIAESLSADTLRDGDQAEASPPADELLLGDISNSTELPDNTEIITASRSRTINQNENRQPESAINEEFIQYTPPELDFELTTIDITLPEVQQLPPSSANEVEEVIVTSLFSGITSGLLGEVASDEDATLWIEEIYYLREEAEELTTLIEDERRDFSDIFPEIGLEDALQEHERALLNDSPFSTTARIVGANTAVEEIVVTGSRINNSDNGNVLGEQTSADLLIEEIYSLGLDLNMLNSELQDERNAFSNEYPEIDIDEALQTFVP